MGQVYGGIQWYTVVYSGIQWYTVVYSGMQHSDNAGDGTSMRHHAKPDTYGEIVCLFHAG